MSEPTVSITPKKKFTLKATQLSQVEYKETKWLWYPYIPAGAITLLFGNGGMGKSWITCSIAADLSQGRALPGMDRPLPPQKILMVSAEDDPGRIILPRMAALNANMDNIFVSEQQFILDEAGIRALEDAMAEYAATILFIDPLVSYLGSKIDMNKSNESRSMMGPLGEAAKRTGTAVVVVHHERKDSKGKAQHRAMGSADFTNSVRSALLVDEAKGGTRYMNHVKHNWSSQGASLAYLIDGDVFQWDGLFDDIEPAPRISTNSLKSKAQAWLINYLKDGPVPSKDVFAAALAAGFTERTLTRAKMGAARSKKLPDGEWLWELDGAIVPPADPDPQTDGSHTAKLMNPSLKATTKIVVAPPKPDIEAILARLKALHPNG